MSMSTGPGTTGPGSRPSAGQPPLKLIGAVVIVVAVGILLAVVALSGGGGDEGPRTSVGPATPTPRPTSESGGLLSGSPIPSPQATIDLARPTAAAASSHLETVGAGDRMVLPKLGISGNLAIKEVGADGVMPDPSTPDEVAYYDFSNWQGLGGAPGRGPGNNAVFSGHVDSGSKACKNGTVPPPCTAVFWELRNIKIGDEIEVYLGTNVYRYRVTANQHFLTDSAPWNQIVSATAQETLTLITCAGSFSSGEYNSRTVVTAVRV